MSQNKYKLVKCYPGSPTLGTIATKEDPYYRYNGACMVFMNIVENHPEFWEKVKLVAFTTEDGHEVHGEYTLFTVGITTNCDNADYWKVSECKLNFLSPPNLIDYKWFYSCVNAEKYIEENKPQYSKKDMIEFANYSTKNFRFDNYPNLDYWINHVKR